MKITLQPSVLRWARQRAQLSEEALAEKFGKKEASRWLAKIKQWETDGEITYKQAETLAGKTCTAFGYLFLPKPPQIIGRKLVIKARWLEPSVRLGLRGCKHSCFPASLADYIRIAEQTGGLDRGIQRAADRSEKNLEKTIERVSALIQPIIIVSMAGVIGMMAYTMISVIYDTIEILRSR